MVEWDGFERAGPVPSTQPLRAQAVLYHGSHEIALQYSSLDDSRAANATIGLQGFDGRTAREASCNTPRRVASRQAICFFDPRHPPANGVAGRSRRATEPAGPQASAASSSSASSACTRAARSGW